MMLLLYLLMSRTTSGQRRGSSWKAGVQAYHIAIAAHGAGELAAQLAPCALAFAAESDRACAGAMDQLLSPQLRIAAAEERCAAGLFVSSCIPLRQSPQSEGRTASAATVCWFSYQTSVDRIEYERIPAPASGAIFQLPRPCS